MTDAPEDRTAEDELRLVFGRVVGFTLAALVLTLGGGVLLILVAAAVFRFMLGG